MVIEKNYILVFIGVIIVMTLFYVLKNNICGNDLAKYETYASVVEAVQEAVTPENIQENVQEAIAQEGITQENIQEAIAQEGITQENIQEAIAQEGITQEGIQEAKNELQQNIQNAKESLHDDESDIDEPNWEGVNPLSKMKLIYDGLNNLTSEMENAKSTLNKDLERMDTIKTTIDKIINDKVAIPSKFDKLVIDNLTSSNISGNEVNFTGVTADTIEVKNLNVTDNITFPKSMNLSNKSDSKDAVDVTQENIVLTKPHTYIYGKYATHTNTKTADSPKECLNACKESDYTYNDRLVHPNACTFEHDKNTNNCRCLWFKRYRPEYYYDYAPATSVVSL